MAKKKMGGLGKGLDSLFADLSDDTGSEASNSTLPLREIEPDPEQPRKRFDDDALNQLADSITELLPSDCLYLSSWHKAENVNSWQPTPSLSTWMTTNTGKPDITTILPTRMC